MYDNYYTLVEEVKETNASIIEQSQKIDALNNNMCVLVVAILIVKVADMIHHIFDAGFKGRK